MRNYNGYEIVSECLLFEQSIEHIKTAKKHQIQKIDEFIKSLEEELEVTKKTYSPEIAAHEANNIQNRINHAKTDRSLLQKEIDEIK